MNVQQEVGIRGSLQLLDPRHRQLGPEPTNGRFGAIVRNRQPLRRSARGALRCDPALGHDSFSAFRTLPGDRLGFLFHGHLSAYSAKAWPRTIRGWIGVYAQLISRAFS